MEEFLLWAYALNSTSIIVHEMDSAYQKEWELFRLPGGSGLFMMLHFPIVLLIFYGFFELMQGSQAGIFVSLLLGFSGMLGFCIHAFFIKSGSRQFTQPSSLFILASMLLSSAANLAIIFSAI